MKWIFTLSMLFALHQLAAQQNENDSTRLLQEVVVEAYATDRSLSEVPASVGYVKASDLQRFSDTNILPAVNILPGVRMEERSPGSYRFSIRGSSLRSPFGVRNVKMYWNGLPFTDGGGNTYLNLVDLNAVGSMEVIKGPGGSLYGAGTGGVVLLKTPVVLQNQISATAIYGSYGLQKYVLGAQFREDNFSTRVQFAHQRADGYRTQSAMEKSVLNADFNWNKGAKSSFTSTLFYADLFYETPGGLNQAQADADPSQARPGNPGAVESMAAVTNRTVFGGLVHDYEWNALWTTTTGVYGAFTTFQNPSIRNYEDRDETNFGLRTATHRRLAPAHSALDGKITFGGEFQHFRSPVAVYNNNAGSPAAVQLRDELGSGAGLIFGQVDLELASSIFVTAGGSINFLKYKFDRIEPAPGQAQERNFDAVLSPRVAVLKKFSEPLSLYASYSNGFSPPSFAEVRPSTNTFTSSLRAERGNNLELGARGELSGTRLKYDVAVYHFRLRNTIVVQRNADGADYFVNAGKTSQRGIEAFVSYELAGDDPQSPVFRTWASYAYQHYRFVEYNVLDTDFSGNKLTGVVPTTFSSGLDLTLRNGFAAHVTLNYVDHIPLNDANTAYADAYVLLGLRTSYESLIGRRHLIRFFAGVDNALDEVYSLGNDLNAFGGRYFNTAMPRNFFGGVTVTMGPAKGN